MFDKKEMWIGGLEGLKEKYLQALCTVNREGLANLGTYLMNETDFFIAPASANNHNNYKGGLVEHSLNVMANTLKFGKIFLLGEDIYDSLILTSLLHDVCKINFYKDGFHMVKHDERPVGDQWIKEPFITIDDKFPVGHGEKSVIILQQFIKLTTHEIMAIRWHMMGFDDSAREYGGSLALRNAANKYPLITVLHMADLAACYLDKEKE